MKKLRFILFTCGLILSIFSVRAESPQDEKGIMVSASFGVFHSHYYRDLTYTGLIVAPRIGYRINNNWAVGALYKYKKILSGANIMDYGIFGQYTILGRPEKGFRLFTDLQVAYSKEHDSYDSDSIIDGPPLPYHRSDNWEVGFTPGVAFRIPGIPVDILLRYLFIGFNNAEHDFVRYYSHCRLGGGDWIIDAGLHRLELGVSVTF